MDPQTTVEPSLAEIVLSELKEIGCEITNNGQDIVKPEDIVVRRYAKAIVARQCGKAYEIEPAKDDALLYWTLAPKIDLQFKAFPDFVQIIIQGNSTRYTIHPRSSKAEAFHHEMDRMRTVVNAIYKPDTPS